MDQHELLGAKFRYGDVFSITLGKQEFGFRPITLDEYHQISLSTEDESSVDFEDAIVRAAVISPRGYDFDKMKAGHVSRLAEEIYKVSGFTDVGYLQDRLAEAREEVEEASYMMKAFVLATMPAYTEEDLESLTMPQLLKKVALAEKIITIQQATMGIGEEVSVKFALDGADEETYEPTAKYKVKESLPSKEQLLSKLRSTEVETSGVPRFSKDDLEKFSEEQLARLAGIPSPEDPISRKLRQVMGG